MTSLLRHLLGRCYFYTGGLLLLFSTAASAAPQAVGEAVYVQGPVQVQNATQPDRRLETGGSLYNGDKVLTGEGRAQIRFIDESVVSVQPQSNYQIENFQYDEADDSKLSAVFRLVKGGLRAVTGLVSDRSKDAYKVHTPVATIGVRGTAHNTRLCQGDCPGKEDGLYHNTWTGITYVANDRGTRNVPAGRAVYVRDKDAPIQELDQIPAVTAVQETEETDENIGEETDSTFQAGEQLTESGEEAVFADQVNFVAGLVGVVMENNSEFGNQSVLLTEEVLVLKNNLPIGVLATDAGGRTLGTVDPDGMQSINDAAIRSEIDSILSGVPSSDLDKVRNNPASLAEYETSSGTAWGRWADGNFLVAGEGGHRVNQLDNNQSVHLVTGPVPDTMPTTGSAEYTFVGGTRSTSTDGSTIGQGVTSGHIAVSFLNASADIAMNVRHAGVDYDVSGDLKIEGTQLRTDGSDFNAFATSSACIESCSTDIRGQFIGPNLDTGAKPPRDAGINYEIHAYSGDSDNITGVGAFRTDGSPLN